MQSVLYAIARSSVHLSHRWISQKQLKLGSCNFHQSSFLQYNFNPEIMMGSPYQTRVGWGKQVFSSFMRRYLKNGTRYDQSYY